ncbi:MULTISPECIES: putative RNA methyltransferase [Halomonadaceae]|uniref:23S rRNA (Guanine(745)-N(1))-methyltransferase n=1 Tax=Halomonas johnsoniae TaxID=502832 RepID=A0ABQ2WE98_9GAMM|nr:MULTISPECIES: methyltransferase domain-containing protein [Halomonas]UDM06499.1 methyltransferase domain-containing protein [Halomonas sp. NyZ770]GGW46666.1 23S rRNA (guanine(745)-N(1))-methyltransferase [Halomonas johnsoniae]
MNSTPFQALACPLDGEPLYLEGNTWRCAARHAFDVARQGYVNLLPVQQKRSTDPGDSKPMVAARQRFLAAGHYRPIAESVSEILQRHAHGQEAYHCLDAGCGEGYYLRELAGRWPAEQSLALMGLDISKWAVLAAARQGAETCRWVVGSNAQLPVQSATLDSVLCLFGFPVHAEFARVLKPGGQLLQVEAGPEHLRELREVIYLTLKPAREKSPEMPAGFVAHSAHELRYVVTLKGAESIGDLLAMTPHLYRASAEGRERAANLEALSLTVDARLIVWERV